MPLSDAQEAIKSGFKTILILGGTAEARSLAEHLHQNADERIKIIYSLAGRTDARPVCGQVRSGGFGGKQGLSDYIKGNHIDIVIDATHPFAATISATAQAVCGALKIPRLCLQRPAWGRPDGAIWHHAATLAEAAQMLPGLSHSPLLTTGRGSLDGFSNIDGLAFFVRVLEKSDRPLPLKNAIEIIARPPFDLAAEKKLLTDYQIDCLVTKNAGGDQTENKILAAAELKIPVLMIDRPAPPVGPLVASVEDALGWLEKWAIINE